MSLVGSLEDLGLGDILQIVSLSRKSGVLRLHCDGGDGRIVLADGMVAGAAVKGDFEDVRGLLVSGGHVGASDLRAAVDAAGPEVSLGDALAAAGLLSPERLETLCRARVEHAVMSMFDWRAGEFIFEVGVDASDPVVILDAPLSSQYIAMEATRKRDEVAHFGDDFVGGEDDGMMFSGESATHASFGVVEPADPVQGVALGTLERLDGLDAPEETVLFQGSSFADAATLPPGPAAEILPEAEIVEPAGVAEAPAQVPARAHLIAIDPDLGALEWLKTAVRDFFERIHIFQQADIGVDRIRHYLGRGVVPVVVVSLDAQADRPGGAAELVSRLRALASNMRIGLLLAEGQAPEAGFEAVDGELVRPVSPGSDREKWVRHEAMADTLREAIRPLAVGAEAPVRSEVRRRDPSLVRLKHASEQLRGAHSDYDILSVPLDFAADLFGRAAMFTLCDEGCRSLAQRGLDRAGGPSDADHPDIAFSREDQPEVFRRVLERRSAIVSSMAGKGDERLALRLGSATARQAFVAPVACGDDVMALLYADGLPGGGGIPDTTGLEIVLDEAGMALERALLRRDRDGRSGSAEEETDGRSLSEL